MDINNKNLMERIEKLEKEIEEIKDPFSSESRERDLATVRQFVAFEINRLHKFNGDEILSMKDVRENLFCMATLVNALNRLLD